VSKRIEDAIEQEDWLQARRFIRQSLTQEPDSHWLLSRLALTYYEQKQYHKALHYDLRALQIEPHCPLAVWGYAGALDMLGRNKKALQVFRWLGSWDEDLLAYGPCGEGIQNARSLIADCFYRIARILEETGQRKRAIGAYKTHLAKRTRGTRCIYPINDVRSRLRKLEAAK